jgi:hypothetical protein
LSRQIPAAPRHPLEAAAEPREQDAVRQPAVALTGCHRGLRHGQHPHAQALPLRGKPGLPTLCTGSQKAAVSGSGLQHMNSTCFRMADVGKQLELIMGHLGQCRPACCMHAWKPCLSPIHCVCRFGVHLKRRMQLQSMATDMRRLNMTLAGEEQAGSSKLASSGSPSMCSMQTVISGCYAAALA